MDRRGGAQAARAARLAAGARPVRPLVLCARAVGGSNDRTIKVWRRIGGGGGGGDAAVEQQGWLRATLVGHTHWVRDLRPLPASFASPLGLGSAADGFDAGRTTRVRAASQLDGGLFLSCGHEVKLWRLWLAADELHLSFQCVATFPPADAQLPFYSIGLVDETRLLKVYIGDGAGRTRVWALTPQGEVRPLAPVPLPPRLPKGGDGGGGGPLTPATMAALDDELPLSPLSPLSPGGGGGGGGAMVAVGKPERGPGPLRAVACANWLVVGAAADGALLFHDVWTGQRAAVQAGRSTVRAMALGKRGELYTAADDGRVACWGPAHAASAAQGGSLSV